MTDATREFCQRCNDLSPVGFHARDDIWVRVAGEHWRWSILCLRCFAALGDEKGIRWEEGMEFYPSSFATHSEAEVEKLRARLDS
jgi:hypothetical protein